MKSNLKLLNRVFQDENWLLVCIIWIWQEVSVLYFHYKKQHKPKQILKNYFKIEKNLPLSGDVGFPSGSFWPSGFPSGPVGVTTLPSGPFSGFPSGPFGTTGGPAGTPGTPGAAGEDSNIKWE